MPLTALALALAAAFVHAGWNLLVARGDDPEAATAAASVVAVTSFAPVAIATWHVEEAAWPYVAGSVAFQLAYFAFLGAAYRRADLSLVYPIARGSAPVIVLLVAALALGASTSPLQAAGVVAAGAGVLLVRGGGSSAGAFFGFAVAATIAGYTLVDNVGIERASSIAYQEVTMGPAALGYAAWLTARRGRAAVARAFRPSILLAGVGMFGAYALVLLALRLAPAAPVAAVRESSVVIATALAALVLKERVTPMRLAGAAVVAAGVVLIAL